MDKQELWMVFKQTGRVEDYLRYRDAVQAAMPPKVEENTQHGADNHGTDRPRTQYR